MDKSRDTRVIDHIIDYCDRINEYTDINADDYEELSGNKETHR